MIRTTSLFAIFASGLLGCTPTDAQMEQRSQASEHSLLANVEVDRASTCSKEPITVTATLLGDESSGADVRILVNGKAGNPAVVSLGGLGSHEIIVQAAAPSGEVDEWRVPVELTACPEREWLSVKTRPSGEQGKVGFQAVPHFYHVKITSEEDWAAYAADLEARGPAEVETYTWDFGDGTTETTKIPFVTHDFSARPYDQSQSTFIVRVSGETARRGVLTGGMSVTMNNLYYINRTKRGTVTPIVAIDKVIKLADGGFEAEYRIRHDEATAIELTEATVTSVPCGDGDVKEEEPIEVTDVLGTELIPSGTSVATLRVKASDVPAGTCNVVYQAIGTAGTQPVYLLIGVPVGNTEGRLLLDEGEARHTDEGRLAMRDIRMNFQKAGVVLDDEAGARLEMSDLLRNKYGALAPAIAIAADSETASAGTTCDLSEAPVTGVSYKSVLAHMEDGECTGTETLDLSKISFQTPHTRVSDETGTVLTFSLKETKNLARELAEGLAIQNDGDDAYAISAQAELEAFIDDWQSDPNAKPNLKCRCNNNNHGPCLFRNFCVWFRPVGDDPSITLSW